MTEQEVVLTLVRERHMRHTCMPRYTPMNWFECDVCEITGSNYFIEYEVKLTVSDFRNDVRKYDESQNRWGKNGHFIGPPITKHHRLSMGDPFGPSQFYYCTPRDMLKPEQIPAWAGWIEISERGGGWKKPFHLYMTQRKPAPRIHREKANPKVLSHINEVSYYRYHSAMVDLVKALEKNGQLEPEVQQTFFAEEEILGQTQPTI